MMRLTFPGYIHHYLCLVSHDRKFCNALTAEVVADSCNYVPDFSALKAAQVRVGIRRTLSAYKPFRLLKGFRGVGELRGQPHQPALEKGVQENQGSDVTYIVL